MGRIQAHSAGVFILAQLHSMSSHALYSHMPLTCLVPDPDHSENTTQACVILHPPPLSPNVEHLLHFEIQLICFHEIGDDLCRLIGWLTGVPLLPTRGFFYFFSLPPRPTATPAEPALLHLCLAKRAFFYSAEFAQ